MYYGFFWGGMPDLNHDNPKVFDEIVEVGRFWLKDIGIDGFRLDAAKHIFGEGREKDTHKFWKTFRSAMESIKPDVYIVREVWDEAQIVSPYADGIPSLFNFDLSSNILDTLIKRDTLISKPSSYINSLVTNRTLFTKVNSTYVDALFLSNHDQKRTASFLKNRQNKIKQAAIILFSLSGRPYIYYGEELGMLGDKPDEYIREPFPWGNESEYQTNWLAPKYNLNHADISVANQLGKANSVLNLYRRLIELRKQNPILSSGDLEEVNLGNSKVLSYSLKLEKQTVLALHNVGLKKEQLVLPKMYSNHSQVLFSFRAKYSLKEGVVFSANGSILMMI